MKENICNIFPEYYLIKINNFDNVAKNTLDEWVYFLKNSEIKDEFTAKGMSEVKEKLVEMNLPPEERIAYNRYKEDSHYQASMFDSSYGDGHYDGKKEGLKEGKVEGLKEGKIEGLKEGKKEGKVEGLKEGKKEGLEEALQKMMVAGISENEAKKILGYN